jgi:hypothetical protein
VGISANQVGVSARAPRALSVSSGPGSCRPAWPRRQRGARGTGRPTARSPCLALDTATAGGLGASLSRRGGGCE